MNSCITSLSTKLSTTLVDGMLMTKEKQPIVHLWFELDVDILDGEHYIKA